MRSREELEQERQEDLKRVLEVEALLLLLLRRRAKKALAGKATATRKAALLFAAVEVTVIQGRHRAGDLALARTEAQVQAALGTDAQLHLSRRLAEQDILAAQSEAHAVTGRWLEGQLPDGRAFNPEWERRASWEADQAFNQARRDALDNLPKEMLAQLWLRWDTVGDTRVCPQCEMRDGDIVPASEGFDPPAPLHGNCRCTETVLGPDEV